MTKVISVRALPGYRLELVFNDGVRGVVAIEDRLFGPVFEPLRRPEVFAQVQVDEYGVVCWPNGADLDSDALHQRVRDGAMAQAGGGEARR